MNWTVFSYYIYYTAAAVAVVLASLPLVHMLQLESYQGRMYLKWLGRHFMSDVVPYLLVGTVALLLRCSYVMLYDTSRLLARICYAAGDAAYLLLLLTLYFGYKRRKQIKPLAFTGRVKRLLAVEFALAFVFTASLFMRAVMGGTMSWGVFLLPNFLRYLPGMLLPLFVFLAYGITYPVEAAVKRWYFNDAKKKLAARADVTKVAITGSFGKTGTKYALGTILSEKHNVLYTPGSFNPPMGVTRVIREQLLAEHEVFIAEMGARYRGDIRELCRLVQPKFGIITAIGKQHLETFGSLEGVIATKGELMESLMPDGCCFFNGDDENCRAMYENCTLKEKYLFGTAEEGLYLCACETEVGPQGSAFTLKTAEGESARCRTKLLGRHNIVNLTGAAACAYRLGLTLSEIAAGIAKVEPVEHRLQLIPGAVTVIDDAFNANPVGSREALNVLASFPGRRICVTPGMVELGAEEAELNRAFGRHMAKCADIAIVIGKAHADPICEGLRQAGFPEACLVRAASLAEATEKLPAYTEPGCVVLFENDLPDNYRE